MFEMLRICWNDIRGKLASSILKYDKKKKTAGKEFLIWVQ